MIFFIYLVLINSGSFILMGVDKRRAKKSARRISEKTLWLFIVIGGSIGGYLGMKRFRHKTKHSQFIYGIPAVMIVHILLISGFIYLNK
ncbi:DUF1294 domain-containing protein [Bacillus hwajinpoensis]|uniref:DUF1294 domain-containing protein n=1 Tax=Guptibacillus hwajinpoensis TaxID=208199 RepID=A0A845EW98_9BACL|nr:DUF1294 domain-containing protein [Pseudalkalibacillus hwajinpoensis]